ncbi:substrate-binding domain-containing protein [Alteromonas sp. KUL49]|uniref:substrate-binding domain-containing protein n=1 Tax=Alteromonas sp. KUL49 TaxID=2480798 RepID=UPI00102EF2E2|nr:substrate-binding domain-containing protein [Alteromonas sp. KUL49]TAP39838.1 hypothetical protein EYS00_11065 [Alteromonas sp. KUL49]GEA11848.1 hypothetical protein KUL49_22230 [Alteromonas sp. KUL49]
MYSRKFLIKPPSSSSNQMSRLCAFGRLPIFLGLVLLTQFAAASQRCEVPKESVNILMFMPDERRGSFWLAANHFAKAVASDFGISLRVVEVEEPENNRVAFESLVKRALGNTSYEQPDFIISMLYGGGELSQLSLFNQHNIPFITINSSLDKRTLQLMEHPREQFVNWIAHMSPNERLAGKQIVDALTVDANFKQLAIIGGYTHSSVNNHRIMGAIERAQQIGLSVVPPVYTNWTKAESMKAANALLRRAPDFDLLLTIGPDIAAGSIEVMQSAGKNVTVGSFDWAASNVNLVERGLLEASLGGHFMEAGWAMILAYDYLHGLDFIDETGPLIDTELGLLNAHNVANISPLIAEHKWQNIDFKVYSKCVNSVLIHYDFSLLQEN